MKIESFLEYTKDLNVLYVEDDKEISDNAKKNLSHYFKSVDVGYNGVEGWLKYLNHYENNGIPYDIVMTDINMPKLNGVELSTKILEKNSQQTIIIISCHDDCRHLMEAINMGISGFLAKPIDTQKLHSLLFKVSQAITDRKFTLKYVENLKNLNAQLADKNIELNRSNKTLEELSHIDSLTGLYNRRYCNIVFNREIKRSQRLKSTITFMMLDIDFFKQYNDIYGHVNGDYALISVGSVMQDVLSRPTDFVFRLGGEEFGVLITDTSIVESEVVAQKLRKAIEDGKINHCGNQASKFLTVSIGVVSYLNGEIPDEIKIMEAADKKLYEAKTRGRNQYVI